VHCAHLNANLNEILIQFKDSAPHAEPFDVANGIIDAAPIATIPDTRYTDTHTHTV